MKSVNHSCVVWALLFSLAIPMLASAQEKKAEPVQATQTQMANRDLYVGGLIMSGIGGAMMGWGLGSPSESVYCYSGRVTTSCYSEGANKGLWILGGAGVAGAGLVMAALGAKKVSVAPMISKDVKGVAGRFAF